MPWRCGQRFGRRSLEIARATAAPPRRTVFGYGDAFAALLQRILVRGRHRGLSGNSGNWSLFVVGEIVRRGRRWTTAGATPARELVRSTR
jgi:hypothetical protein